MCNGGIIVYINGDIMKKILLISNYVFHYRQKIYNYFYEEFRKDGYNFEVLASEIQNVNYDLKFNNYQIPFSIFKYIKFIKNNKPDYVILFLHLKNLVMFPIIFYCKIKKIPVIYWNQGINTRTPNAKLKNSLFRLIHNLCDALITYTPDTCKYFNVKNYNKLFVANNTLNLTDIDKSKYNKKDIREKYNIKEKNIILFASRMLPYKRVDLLIECFKDEKDIGVVMVGPGMSNQLLEIINNHSNLYYLNELYGEEMNEIYSIADIFSTPGHIGLSICEAFFWGLPVILLNNFHAPEIYYMKNGINGYIVKDSEELKEKVRIMFNDTIMKKCMKKNCIETYKNEMRIDYMYKSFIKTIKYCEKKRVKYEKK